MPLDSNLIRFPSTAALIRVSLFFVTIVSPALADPVVNCPDCLDLNVVASNSYSNQDQHANVRVENSGATLVLTDNTSRKTVQTFNVSADTILEFDFESTDEAEIHGIGFDEDNIHNNGVRYFALHGTQTWSGTHQDFNDYTGGGPKHYVIPVGQYRTGSSMHLVFINDNDKGLGFGGNSRFSNVRIVTGGSGNLKPALSNPGTQSTAQNDAVNIAVSAIDPNRDDTLGFSDGGTLPPGLSIDASSGNISGTAVAVGIYNVAITVVDGNGESDTVNFSWSVFDSVAGCQDCLDFDVIGTDSYSNQDEHANLAVEDGGLTLALADNTSRRTIRKFDIAADTVLEFDFESTNEGEIHGIGFDEDNNHNNSVRYFSLYGTQTWPGSNQDFNDYAGGGPIHYVIPVGQYYPDGEMHLVFINDIDSGPGIGPDSRFSNVRIVTGGSGNMLPVISSPGLQTTDQGESVNLTVLVADPNIGDALTFSDSGSLPPGLSINNSGNISGIPSTIGSYIVTIAVNDGNGGSDDATFQWFICDPTVGCVGNYLDFNFLPTTPYSNQDEHANVTIEDGGLSLVLADNTSRKTVQTFNITENTVLEFDFDSTFEGEIHGIGFDENDNHSDDRRIFALYGTQVWNKNNHDFNDYNGSGLKHYAIPVGQYYRDSAMHLVLVDDADAGSGIGPNSRFSNIQISELGPSQYRPWEAILDEAVGFAQGVTGGKGKPVVTVSNLNDSGPGSLRQALASHPGGSWIKFSQGLAGTISLSGYLTPPSNTTIDGRGADITIGNSPDDSFRMTAAGSGNVAFLYLKIAGNGNDGMRFGSYSDASTEIDVSTIWLHHISFIGGVVDEYIDLSPRCQDVTLSYLHLQNNTRGILIDRIDEPYTLARYSGITPLRLTSHHNWFDQINRRAPLARHSMVHSYNNLHENWSSSAVMSKSGDSSVPGIGVVFENSIGDAGGATDSRVARHQGEGGIAAAAIPLNSVGTHLLRNGATIVEHDPTSVFAPNAFYEYDADPADAALEAHIRANAGWQDVAFPE